MVNRMATAKEAILHILDQQPDDSSYDELLQELAFKKMIDAGLADVDSNKTVSNEELSEEINSW